MILPAGLTILQIILIIVFLIVGWIALRFLLRLTTRIACGCVILLAVGVIAWLIIR